MFYEDRAHEGFIKALVERIVKEEAPNITIEFDVITGKRGSKILRDFYTFMKDVEKCVFRYDFIIVTIDGNCKGVQQKIRELVRKIRKSNPYINKIVFAVPDPHIEKWYIIDQNAFKSALRLSKAPALPQQKCKRGYYKDIINHTIANEGFYTYLSAAEYAEDIIHNMSDIYYLCRMYSDFGSFVDTLRTMVKSSLRVVR